MKDDFEKDITNNSEDLSNNFLKDDSIKEQDTDIKLEIVKTEFKGEQKESKKQDRAAMYRKDNLQTFKIILAIFLAIMWLVLPYFVYSKLFKTSRKKFSNQMMTEFVNVSETPQEEPNSLAALGQPIEKNLPDVIVEEGQEGEVIDEEPIVEEQEIIQEENNNQVDDYDLMILETVYDEVINKGNEGYLYNFSSDELAIIRNTLYARRGYKFKKKKYQNYFGAKSWYVPTTDSQNILTKKEEKLANIIKRYE